MATRRSEIIVDATPALGLQVVERIRVADTLDLERFGRTPEEVMLYGIKASIVAKAWLVDGRAEAAFGVVADSFMSHAAFPWMLATGYVEKHPVRFLRSAKQVFNEMTQAHPYMINLVDDRHTLAKRFMQWLGFRKGKPRFIGDSDNLFWVFELGRA